MYTICAGGFSASLDFLLLDSNEQIVAISCFQRGLESKSVVAAVATGSRLSVLPKRVEDEWKNGCDQQWLQLFQTLNWICNRELSDR